MRLRGGRDFRSGWRGQPIRASLAVRGPRDVRGSERRLAALSRLVDA